MPKSGRATWNKAKAPFTRGLWLGVAAMTVGCVPYLNQKARVPALSPVPKGAEVTLLGTRIDHCVGACSGQKQAVRRGLSKALRQQLGWKLVPRGSTARSVDFEDGQTCLIKGQEPPGWAIAARLMSADETSRGAWVTDALTGSASVDAAVQITLWNPQRRVVLDHVVSMVQDNEKRTNSVVVSPQIPLQNGFEGVSFDPNSRGTVIGIAEEAARTGMSALSLALEPETSNFTLVFNEDDARAKPAVTLAADGKLTAALAKLQRIQPRSASVEYDLGMVLLGRGDMDEALRHFEAADRGGLRTGWSARYMQRAAKRRAYERSFPHPACWVASQEPSAH